MEGETQEDIATEYHDADVSDNNSVFEDKDDVFSTDCERQIDLNLVDRSFTNLGYIGYGEGIKLEDLD